MGLDIYYKEDITNALLAAEQSANATAIALGGTDDPFAAGFQVGYQAALTTLALAFGLTKNAGRALVEPAWYPVVAACNR